MLRCAARRDDLFRECLPARADCASDRNPVSHWCDGAGSVHAWRPTASRPRQGIRINSRRGWPLSARLAIGPEPWRTSLHRTDTGRSALVAGTGLHAPKPPLTRSGIHGKGTRLKGETLSPRSAEQPALVAPSTGRGQPAWRNKPRRPAPLTQRRRSSARSVRPDHDERLSTAGSNLMPCASGRSWE